MTLKIDRPTRMAPAAPLQSLPYDSLGMDAESLKRGFSPTSSTRSPSCPSTWTASGSLTWPWRSRCGTG